MDIMDSDLLALIGQPWRAEAACAGIAAQEGSYQTFFPARSNPEESSNVAARRARTICQGCPVRIECLAAEIQREGYPDHGIFGGFTSRQRRALVQHLRTCRHSACTEFDGMCLELRTRGVTHSRVRVA